MTPPVTDFIAISAETFFLLRGEIVPSDADLSVHVEGSTWHYERDCHPRCIGREALTLEKLATL
jgi:hypothetical protein